MFRRLEQAVTFFKSILPEHEQAKLSDDQLADILVNNLEFDLDLTVDLIKSLDCDDYEEWLEKGGQGSGRKKKFDIPWYQRNKERLKEERAKKKQASGVETKPKAELNWHKLSSEEKQKRIDAAHKKLKEAEAGTEEKHKVEAKALQLWLNEHKVEKGGPGSGQKGHHTDRKPYPGEEQHKLGQMTTKVPKGLQGPSDLRPAHYSDPPMMKKYRELVKKLGPQAVDGRFHYDPKSDKIVATDEGKRLAEAAAGMQHKE